ncbi:hypothetical protein MMC21_007024 [Puttea exsequens]|nr:hypothetical protein [Puttea exsequens]
MSNAGSSGAMQYPVQASAAAIGAAGGNPHPNRTSLSCIVIEGLADIAAKISGVNTGWRCENDSEYHQ